MASLSIDPPVSLRAPGDESEPKYFKRFRVMAMLPHHPFQRSPYGETVRNTGMVIDFAGLAYSMTLTSPV